MKLASIPLVLSVLISLMTMVLVGCSKSDRYENGKVHNRLISDDKKRAIDIYIPQNIYDPAFDRGRVDQTVINFFVAPPQEQVEGYGLRLHNTGKHARVSLSFPVGNNTPAEGIERLRTLYFDPNQNACRQKKNASYFMRKNLSHVQCEKNLHAYGQQEGHPPILVSLAPAWCTIYTYFGSDLDVEIDYFDEQIDPFALQKKVFEMLDKEIVLGPPPHQE